MTHQKWWTVSVGAEAPRSTSGGGMGFTDLSNPLMCGALHDDSVDMDSQSPYIPSSIRLISPGEWQKRKAEVPYF